MTRRVNQPDYDDGNEYGSYDDYVEVDLTSFDFSKMNRDDMLKEIERVDVELLNINHRLAYLAKNRCRIFKGDSEALNLQLRTLKQRSELLLKCLNKVMPDKKSVDTTLSVSYTNTDQLPDELLARIALGKATDEELKQYGYLFDAPEATQ